ENLTRMARRFAATHDPLYESFFYHIVGMGNGVWARPDSLDQDFWSKALVIRKLPPASQRSISTENIIKQLNITAEMRKKLEVADRDTLALIKLEIAAINAIKGVFADAQGDYTLQKDPDLKWANSLLVSQQYDKINYKIVESLSLYSSLQKERLGDVRLNYFQTQIYLLSVLLIAIALMPIIGVFLYKSQGNSNETGAGVSLRKTFEEVRESEKLLKGIFDNIMASIYMKDMDGRLIMINRRFIDILGGNEEDYLGKTDFDLFPYALAAAYQKNDIEVLEKGVSIEFEERAFNVKSDRRFLSVKFPIKDKYGKIFAICGISSDIIGSREAEYVRAEWETQLIHSQTMEAIGQLTSGVAHDFNNILNIIHGNLELLKGRLFEDEDSLKRIENAMKGTARGAEVTQKLFKFAMKKVHEVRKTNVGTLIKGLEGLILKSLTSSISLNVDLDPVLWPIAVDQSELEDAILNLALNARDSMPDGGTIILNAKNVTLDDAHAVENANSKAGKHVMICVEDTGCGFTDEIKEKVFEPFFTTKEQGKGTGLGLSMVYGFVKRTGGHIDISSAIGEGTTIRMYLPLAPVDNIDTGIHNI
ncbi:MAG: ATP-binding protein, partial [Sneathiella sp.]